MEPISEEVPKNESASTLTNGSIPSDKPEISSKTPLLSISSPDDEFSEKLTKLSPTPAYHRGFSGMIFKSKTNKIVILYL